MRRRWHACFWQQPYRTLVLAYVCTLPQALGACGAGDSSAAEAGLPPDSLGDLRDMSGPFETAAPDANELGAPDASETSALDATTIVDAGAMPEDAFAAEVFALSDAAGGEAASPLDLRRPDDATQATCPGICNSATPVYPTVGPDGGQGNITMYTTEASNGGACNYGATSVLYFAAVNVNVVPGDGRGQWQGGRICGQCVEVTAVTSQGPTSVVVRIMDKCPDGYCGMDLGGNAPAAIMQDGFGRYDGAWRFISCAGHPEVSDGPPALSVVAGANAYWSRVRIRNPAGAVDSITWQDVQGGSGSFAWASDPENAFEVPTSVLQSSAARVTVTVHFADGGTAAAALTPAQLAAENTSYSLQ